MNTRLNYRHPRTLLAMLTLVFAPMVLAQEKPLPQSTEYVEGYPLEIIAKLEQRDRRAAQMIPRSVIDNYRIWPSGREITVAFRGGTDQARSQIERVASVWPLHGNFSFRFRSSSGQFLEWTPQDATFAADIRIGFDLGGYWSLLGTDARNAAIVGPGSRSMNLSGMAGGNLTSNEQGTVIHEFGHALGFHHEHQNPNGGCDLEFRWDDDPGYIRTTDAFGQLVEDPDGRRPGIYSVLAGPPNHWSRPQIDFNLRQLPNSSAFTVSAHDPDSVMHYSFPLWMFVNGASSPCFTGRNQELSAQDIAGTRIAYPTTPPTGDRQLLMAATPELRQLFWMSADSERADTDAPPAQSPSAPASFGTPCCGNANSAEAIASGNPTTLETLEKRVLEQSRIVPRSVDGELSQNEVAATVSYANELAGEDDQKFTRMVVGSRAQAIVQDTGDGTNQNQMVQLTAMLFSPSPTSGLIWDNPELNQNFRDMMNRAAEKDAGLIPVTGPPVMARVVGPGSQVVGDQRFRDCVAVGARIGGQDRFCCTGTLVAPNVVVTAGHCYFCNGGGANNAVVYVGGDVTSPGDVYVGTAHRHPEYNQAQHNDLAIIILDRPVDGVTPRRIATADEVDKMTFGRVVGFGNSDFQSTGGFGTKRMVDVPVASLDCNSQGQPATWGCDPNLELIAGFVGLGPDSCNGDSGGPIYSLVGADARDDDAWVVVGATSRATALATRPCGDGGIYERLDKFSSFIEQVSSASLNGQADANPVSQTDN